MPSPARASASRWRSKWGCRRDRGIVRTSTNRLTSWPQRSCANSARARVEWPTVQMVPLGAWPMSSGYATSARIRPVSGLPEYFNAADFFVDRHLAEGRGGRTAFRFHGRSVTYAAVAELSSRAASALANLGVEIENRVVLALADSPAFAAVFWGAARLGAVAVPVPPQLAPAEQAFVLNDSRARVAVVDAGVVPALASVRAD